MRPQVLARLGALSVFSASCIIGLERFQPVFAIAALTTLGYQGWLVWRRPPRQRTTSVLLVLWRA